MERQKIIEIAIGFVASIVLLFLGALINKVINKDKNQNKIRHLENQVFTNAKNLKDFQNEISILKKNIMQIENEKSELDKTIARLKIESNKYFKVRKKLEQSPVVYYYEQPVILLGPRAVGKTSLLMQLHAPWVTSLLQATVKHSSSKVPICDFYSGNVPHFADSEIITKKHIHLLLHIHDFPGELSAQQKIKQIIIDETNTLRENINNNLGVVLICMVDAEEAVIGISRETRQYYNGDLFRELHSLNGYNKIQIERLIYVFNKLDKLKLHKPNLNNKDLLKLCVDSYDKIFEDLYRVCNPEKVCEVFTILSREDMHFNNQGASIVKGEASRNIANFFSNSINVKEIIPEQATNYISTKHQIS